MTWGAFRTSYKFYKTRPPANCRAARFAWDWFAKDGPIASMRLLDGVWFCDRGNNDVLDGIEAAMVLDKVWEARNARRH